MAKKKDKEQPKRIEVRDEAADEEEVTCPVCGKPVGLDIAACPHCGAEFEEDAEITEEAAEEAQEGGSLLGPAKGAAAAEDETAECPVCGKYVKLDVTACPFCGAEFEEEEVEEVIEVEEQAAPAKARAVEAEEEEAPVRAHAARKVEPEEEPSEEQVEVAEEEEVSRTPILRATEILDLRVIGVALIILGVIGSQISTMIDWYWTWVPPIKDNIAMFVAIPAAVIVVGLLVFMLVKKAVSGGKKVPAMMPNLFLSLFLFGILALVMIMLWNPINSALESSKIGVAGAFIGLLVVGVLAMFMGQRMTARSSA